MPADGAREDLLVSICLSDAPHGAAELADLQTLADDLARRFRYWEILVACDARERTERAALLHAVPNLRVLWLRPGASFYERRHAVAGEAIGDVAVLSVPDELAHLDVVAMAADAADTGTLVIGELQTRNPLGGAVAALGRSAGLRIAPRDMLTVAFPRGLLEIVMSHPDRLLALRFVPVDGRLPVRLRACRPVAGLPPSRGRSDGGPKFLRRLHILHRLMIGAAPRVLTLTALVSLLTTLGALVFAIYGVGVWLTLSHIQPGWLTTSLAISGTAAFLGLAVFGLSIGLQRLLEVLAGAGGGLIIDESGTVELFGKVREELNVEIGSGAPGSADPR